MQIQPVLNCGPPAELSHNLSRPDKMHTSKRCSNQQRIQLGTGVLRNIETVMMISGSFYDVKLALLAVVIFSRPLHVHGLKTWHRCDGTALWKPVATHVSDTRQGPRT